MRIVLDETYQSAKVLRKVGKTNILQKRFRVNQGASSISIYNIKEKIV